ncbi:unnamed protein product [Lampetra fluviatilis]
MRVKDARATTTAVPPEPGPEPMSPALSDLRSRGHGGPILSHGTANAKHSLGKAGGRSHAIGTHGAGGTKRGGEFSGRRRTRREEEEGGDECLLL